MNLVMTIIHKLLSLKVNRNITAWILEFLTGRPQYVKLNSTKSNTILCNTGGPQGCVLSPILYTIYTNDYRSKHETTHLIKFADDSAIIGLINLVEKDYFEEISMFLEWCNANFLKVNLSKTKEMIFDFRREKPTIPPLVVDQNSIEVTDSYKYLGLTIDNKFTWKHHVNNIVKKVNQRLYFLRKLRSFHLKTSILHIFYTSTIESLINFGIICYGSNLGKQHITRINKLIRKASKTIGTQLPTFESLYETNVLKKAEVIVNDITHPLRPEFEFSTRSKRLISKRARTDRYRNSFAPTAVRLWNTQSK